MPLKPRLIDEYHVFLASPGDMNVERQAVRRFFDEYNRHTASLHGLHFTVIDWENYATAGIGRPQELITEQTLDKFRDSLALVIGLMGQRFGSPSGTHESGTEEEFEWALSTYLQFGFPEVKWFFRKIDNFIAPSDLGQIEEAFAQWKKVCAFRKRLQDGAPQLFTKDFSDPESFRTVLREDLSLWLNATDRPWAKSQADDEVKLPTAQVEVPRRYYENIVQDFQWLDIAGIDNDRAFQIPLSEMYVRLQVMLDEDSQSNNGDELQESGPINIHAALERYRKLVIVGDPGSGKSTFLKFIALMIARSVLEGDPTVAFERLSLEAPLPIPVFLPCWDLSDFIQKKKIDATPKLLTDFIADRFNLLGGKLSQEALEQMLESGSCCLLFDGLDEVPTEQGRAIVSRLVEKFVAQYSKNRYVVTSRVRAYSGDTILRGEFTRCDIQEFNRDDRNEFLQNWFALLFKLPREEVSVAGSESRKALDSLIAAIEDKDRLRVLAVNPLLLTVVAIVHWNRKRLPEQRVDLYDECVDVLLGQRKEAEQNQRAKTVEALDEKKEEQTRDDRTWVRKRFSEIALQILRDKDEEITKARIVEILRPRFLDRGAKNNEEADSKAELFLDRQELRSGLLVSRRSNSYRFVHLTFQEYLAAWNLANQELAEVKVLIEPHLRQQKWFETLQLLGGEWAKSSDEKLDSYVAHLLEQQGESIAQRAPIIALCANIVNDTKAIAEIKPRTRLTYEVALKGTLQVFSLKSKVPAKTQLEILEALGQLGAVVKDHLVRATKSGHYLVRSCAIKMLVPHLLNDDLFNMGHILDDRSQETIAAYLSSLLDRDPERTRRMLVNTNWLGEKAVNAIDRLVHRLMEDCQEDQAVTFVTKLRSIPAGYGGLGMMRRVLNEIVARFPQSKKAWELITGIAREDKDGSMRQEALRLLAQGRKEETATWELITGIAREDKDRSVRQQALELYVVHRYGTKVPIILTRDRDGLPPYINFFTQPVTKTWIARCAAKLNVATEEVRLRFDKLTDVFPLKFKE